MRRGIGCDKCPVTGVSIHASVKDATCHISVIFYIFKGFNPRIRKGCDSPLCLRLSPIFVSIHASVKDATVKLNLYIGTFGFNPRIRKGCDQKLWSIV